MCSCALTSLNTALWLILTLSIQIAKAAQLSSDSRLGFQIAEIFSAAPLARGPVCISVDHSKTPSANFDTDQYSLTIAINGVISHFEIVPSTGHEHIRKALQVIGLREREEGARVILFLDNVPHSGNTPLIQNYMEDARAEAVVQDIFHVVKKANEGLSVTDNFFKSGEVNIHSLVLYLVPLKPLNLVCGLISPIFFPELSAFAGRILLCFSCRGGTCRPFAPYGFD